MRWQETFDRLDRISRTRALTDAESALLEKAIHEMDSLKSEPTRQGAWSKREVARFCDLVADGATISAASRALGRSRCAGNGLFCRIRRSMGWQAA